MDSSSDNQQKKESIIFSKSTVIACVVLVFAFLFGRLIYAENLSSNSLSSTRNELGEAVNQGIPPTDFGPLKSRHIDSNVKRNDKKIINLPPTYANNLPSIQTPKLNEKIFQKDFEETNLKYIKWRYDYLVDIYQVQKWTTWLYGLILLLLLFTLIWFLGKKIYVENKRIDGGENNEWIVLSLKEGKIKIKMNAFLFIFIVVVLYLFHYYVSAMYPIA